MSSLRQTSFVQKGLHYVASTEDKRPLFRYAISHPLIRLDTEEPLNETFKYGLQVPGASQAAAHIIFMTIFWQRHQEACRQCDPSRLAQLSIPLRLVEDEKVVLIAYLLKHPELQIPPLFETVLEDEFVVNFDPIIWPASELFKEESPVKLARSGRVFWKHNYVEVTSLQEIQHLPEFLNWRRIERLQKTRLLCELAKMPSFINDFDDERSKQFPASSP